MSDTYKTVRMYQNGNKYNRQTLETGLTLAEAKKYCADPETSSRTATGYEARKRTEQRGAWFDGYEEE